MAAISKLGYGTKFGIGDAGTPETFVDIPLVSEIQWPQLERDEVEDTHLESTGRKRTYLAGLMDWGEAVITLNWDPDDADHQECIDAVNESHSVDRSYRITSPAGTTWVFKGVAKFAPGPATKDGLQTATFTVKVSGEVTRTTV